MAEALHPHLRKKKKFNPFDDEELQPEFQVAPMVDVLLVLLLFFMATATTEVRSQTANLELPKADSGEDPDKKAGQYTINIEKLADKIKGEDAYYDKADDLIPVIKARVADSGIMAAKFGSDPNAFRVLVRADRDTPYSKVRDIMKACAKAGVVNVTFAITEGGTDAKGAAPAGDAK